MNQAPPTADENSMNAAGAVILFMIGAADQHGAGGTGLSPTALDQAIGQAMISHSQAMSPFRAMDRHLLLRQTVSMLEHSGHLGRDFERHSITESGRRVLSTLPIGPEDQIVLRRCVAAALAHQPPQMTRMQRAVQDMRRGRPPNWR